MAQQAAQARGQAAPADREFPAVDINKFLDISAQVEVDDLDWELCARQGLTADEIFLIGYMSNIENHTIIYMREMLATTAALESEVVAFLSMWNYEEFFHGRALARVLEVCGQPLAESSIRDVRKKTGLRERVEGVFSSILSVVYRKDYPALYMAWGAINEFSATQAYEQLAATTSNQPLAILCRRIAKQERRHFAWYFNGARERLARSPRAQRMTRAIMTRFFTPVGAGVKPVHEVDRAMRLTFPGAAGLEVGAAADARIGALPGMSGVDLLTKFVKRAQETGAGTPPAPAAA